MIPSPTFDANSLSRDYAFLDACPDHLFDDVVTLAIGSLPERVAGIAAWRAALLDGRLPPADTWPEPAISGPVRDALSQLDIPRFCKGEEELVDRLLTDIVQSFRRCHTALSEAVSSRLRALEDLERQRLEAEEAMAAERQRRPPQPTRLAAAALDRLRRQAEADARNLQRPADDELLAAWGDRARAWAQIGDVFGDLGNLMGRGFDLSSGILRHTGWLEVLKLRELVARLPQLQAVVQQLGRLQDSDADESVAERLFTPVRRIEEERREVRSPHVPAETRGIERSGEVSRMLPGEAALLGHPRLRLLWHARRAERALLTYRVEGIEIERRLVEVEAQVEVDGRRPRPQRGPILAVIDTSGSMHGLPETVAKAVVLEALRTAHTERRRCFLYAYSGPGQVLEHELSVSREGLGELLQFLSMSFGGGTDIGAMSLVVDRLRQDSWKKADVLLVSDGEWGAPREVVAGVAAARENGTRFHGLQIGNRGKTGLHTICDPVHVYGDWSALARR